MFSSTQRNCRKNTSKVPNGDKLGHTSCRGFWTLICDSEITSSTCSTRINSMLEILSKLSKKLPELFPIPPKATKLYDNDNLQVFTSCESDEEIIKSAEAIRRCVDFPFIMYHLGKSADSKKLLYFHTPDGELYKQCKKDNSAGSVWQLISKNSKSKSVSDKFLRSQVIDREPILSSTKSTSVSDELLPSQVIDRDHIHLPTNKEDFEKSITKKGGKWILHCSDWKTLDNLWKNLIPLYEAGILVGLKSCTPKFSITEIAPQYHTKAIKCYTADAGCILSVKTAATSIFIATGYDAQIYYKSNEASLAGIYRHEGSNSVSKYMCTSSSKMFEKDYLRRWKKITLEE